MRFRSAAGNGNVAVGGGQGIGLRRHILDGDIAVAGIHREACKRPAGQFDGHGADALAVVHAHGSVALEALNVQARGCNGFDGDVESRVASSVECHLKRLKLLNINANDTELAYAA